VGVLVEFDVGEGEPGVAGFLDAAAGAAKRNSTRPAPSIALRALARIDGDPRTDRLIAAFLFDGDARPDAEQLWAAGIDPVEVHELDVRAAAIRRMPPERWAAVLRAVDGTPID